MLHGEADSGVRRRLEKHKLRGTGEQYRPEFARGLRRRLLEVTRQQRLQLAGVAQHGSGDEASESAVARGQRVGGEFLGECIIERVPLMHDGGDEPYGGFARGKPSRSRRRAVFALCMRRPSTSARAPAATR